MPRQLAYLLAIGTAVIALAVVAVHHFRLGTAILAADLAAVALARAVLPPERLGMLVVRRRSVDIAAYLGLAFALGVLAAVVPG